MDNADLLARLAVSVERAQHEVEDLAREIVAQAERWDIPGDCEAAVIVSVEEKCEHLRQAIVLWKSNQAELAAATHNFLAGQWK